MASKGDAAEPAQPGPPKYKRVERKATEPGDIAANEIRIKANQSRRRTYILYALKLLQREEDPVDSIVLKAMGRAINKGILIAEVVKRRVAGLHQLIELESNEIVDTWEPVEEGLDTITTTRKVSCMTITLSKKQLDASKPGYQAPLPADQVKPEESIDDANTGGPRRRRGGRGGRGGRGRGRGRGGGRGGGAAGAQASAAGDGNGGAAGSTEGGGADAGRGRGRGSRRGRNRRGRRRGGANGGEGEGGNEGGVTNAEADGGRRRPTPQAGGEGRGGNAGEGQQKEGQGRGGRRGPRRGSRRGRRGGRGGQGDGNTATAVADSTSGGGSTDA